MPSKKSSSSSSGKSRSSKNTKSGTKSGKSKLQHIKKGKSSTRRAQEGGERKPHRYRPGTVALRHMKSLQKKSYRPLLASAPTVRLVKECVENTKRYAGIPSEVGVRLSYDSVKIIRSFLQDRLVETTRLAEKLSSHNGRKSVRPEDIRFADNIDASYFTHLLPLKSLSSKDE